MTRLSENEINVWLQNHDGWFVENDELKHVFVLKNFSDSIRFVIEISKISETQNHHPEIFISYNKVTVSMNTHDAGNVITDRDIKLAAVISGLR